MIYRNKLTGYWYFIFVLYIVIREISIFLLKKTLSNFNCPRIFLFISIHLFIELFTKFIDFGFLLHQIVYLQILTFRSLLAAGKIIFKAQLWYHYLSIVYKGFFTHCRSTFLLQINNTEALVILFFIKIQIIIFINYNFSSYFQPIFVYFWCLIVFVTFKKFFFQLWIRK